VGVFAKFQEMKSSILTEVRSGFEKLDEKEKNCEKRTEDENKVEETHIFKLALSVILIL